MIFSITQFVRFDVEKEKKRLNSCFEGEQLHRQLHIFQLFLDGDHDECYKAMLALPYDEERECPEIEYVCPFIFDVVKSYMEHNKKLIIERVPDEYIQQQSEQPTKD